MIADAMEDGMLREEEVNLIKRQAAGAWGLLTAARNDLADAGINFASGVHNFQGVFATVGENGAERVFLPKGSSVEPAGRAALAGGPTFIFNSPIALDPLSMQQQMTMASRQYAFAGAVG